MALPPEAVYRKTARGQAALATRSADLPARLRTALILVNGRDPLAVLQTRLGADAMAQIETLLVQGLIEALTVRPPLPAARAAPAPTPAPATRPDSEVLAALVPLKREAVRRLAPQFGPDVEVVCAALLAATSAEAYRSALGGIEAKLAIYLGRAKAKQALEGLWP